MLLQVLSLKPALAALPLGSAHPGLRRKDGCPESNLQSSLRWLIALISQTRVTQGPKQSLEVSSAIGSLFIP